MDVMGQIFYIYLRQKHELEQHILASFSSWNIKIQKISHTAGKPGWQNCYGHSWTEIPSV